MLRHIDGPDHEWLTEEEAIRWLRISGSLFQKMARSGLVPKRGTNRQDTVYPWRGIVAVSWLLELGYKPGEETPESST